MIAGTVRVLGWASVGLLVAAAGVWGALALHYSGLSPGWLWGAAAAALGLLALAALGSIAAGRSAWSSGLEAETPLKLER